MPTVAAMAWRPHGGENSSREVWCVYGVGQVAPNREQLEATGPDVCASDRPEDVAVVAAGQEVI
jgi:hypothetical protein